MNIVPISGRTAGFHAIPRNLKETLRWIKCGRYAEHTTDGRDGLPPPTPLKESFDSRAVVVQRPRGLQCGISGGLVWLWMSGSVALSPVRSFRRVFDAARSQECLCYFQPRP